jgi:hypothetical protein
MKRPILAALGVLNHCLAITTMALASSVLWAQAGPADGDIDLVALNQDIDHARKRLTRLRGEVDRSTFEPDAMVDRLEFDAGLIIEFVKAETAFQPYEGALRGVAGTLQATAGNSLDQSILLASLLKSAGYDARVVTAQLNDTDAMRLLRQTGAGKPNASLEYLQSSVSAAFPGTGSSAPAMDLQTTQAYQAAQAQEKLLLNALASKGISLESRDVSGRWLPVAREYFWVQHREGAADEWQDTHPAFGGAEPPAGLTAQEIFADSIPARYHHTFSIGAWMEQKESGKIVKHRLMSPSCAQAAILNGVAIRYRNAPNGLTLKSASELDQAIANTQFLMPMLNGAQAPGAQAFDLKGRAIDPFALGGPAAGIFKTIGDKMLDATEGVQGNADGQPIMALHSMWLEFSLTTPSGQEQTHRRYLLPPRNDYSGDEQELIWPLMTNHVYMLAVGGQPLDFLADRYLDTAIQDMDWMDAMVHKTFEPDAGTPLPAELPVDFPALTQYWLMERHPNLDPGVIAYRSVPGLMGIRRGFRDATTAFAGVDIVWNAIEHVQVNDTGMSQVPRASLSRGVWETALEAVPGKILDLDPKSVTSTSRLFKLAQQQGVATRVILPGQETMPTLNQLDDQARAFMNTDLQQGYAIVTPESVPNGAAMAGWWRVNPETGETLGMTGDGYGQESVEYVMMDMIMTATSLVNAVIAIRECEQKPSMVTKLCCLVEANINNVASLSFGGILGATVGTAGAAVFEIANTFSGGALMPSANAGCDQLPDTEW